MKALLLLTLLFLTACSSTEGRAPVYDAISNKSSSEGKVGTHIARTKIIGQDTYTVRPGDTMYSIAWRAGIDVNVLIKRNNIKKPYTIHTGQVLKLYENNQKTVSNSQNTKNQGLIGCTAQSCKKKTQSKVVIKSSKEYPVKVSGEKIVKEERVNQSETIQKVTGWKWPSKGRLTKTFANSVQGMKGISISNTRGTPVYAAASGKVVYSGSGLRGYGNLIIIRHNYDYLSAYAHNEKLLIKENEQVKVGQKIAIMGDSGTDSVRLHFDIRYRGKSVDPLRYLPKRR